MTVANIVVIFAITRITSYIISVVRMFLFDIPALLLVCAHMYGRACVYIYIIYTDYTCTLYVPHTRTHTSLRSVGMTVGSLLLAQFRFFLAD